MPHGPPLSCPRRGGGSSVGRAPGCGPGGRGFESRSPPLTRRLGRVSARAGILPPAMMFPWGAVRISSLVASAALAGYLWRGALEEPWSADDVLPREALPQQSQPPVIYVPPARRPGPAEASSSGRQASGNSVALDGTPATGGPSAGAAPPSRSRPPGPGTTSSTPTPPTPAATPPPAATPAPTPTPMPTPTPAPAPAPAPTPSGNDGPQSSPAPAPGTPSKPPMSPTPHHGPTTPPAHVPAKPPTATPPAHVPAKPARPAKPPKPTEPTNPDVRPGNGYGDDNHEHNGPPGQDVDHAQEGPPPATPDPQHDTGGTSGEHHPSDPGHEVVAEHGHGDDHGSGADKRKKP